MDDGFSQAELGPKMQACNERERKFVWYYLQNGGDGAKAARAAGYSDDSKGAAGVAACRALQRERILEALDEVGRRAFRELLVPAVIATRTLIKNKKHPKHAQTVLSTLSRLGLVERTGVDMNMNIDGQVTINHTDAAVNDLRVLIGLGVSEEKLIEVFGFSGLERYRKMLLAEADRRARPVMIEHQDG